jgi:hypothetical protein
MFGSWTLLTGGICYRTPREAYRDLEPIAADLDAGRSLPMASNAAHLVRVFVELDCFQRLPTASELWQLLSLLSEGVRTLFALEKAQVLVSACSPRVKKGRTTAGVGLHLVFPSLAVPPATLHNILKFLQDALLHARSPWAEALDLAPVKPWYATLRPDGVPKRAKCAVCEFKTQRPSSRVACPVGCFGGSVFPKASVYQLWASITYFGTASREARVEHPVHWSTLRKLQATSLHPAPGTVAAKCSLDAHEAAVPRSCASRVYLPQREDPAAPSAKLARELAALVRRLFPDYQHLTALGQCTYQPETRCITGKQLVADSDPSLARKCLVAGRVHKNNTVYFTLDLDKRSLAFRCFDPECSSTSAPRKKPSKDLYVRLEIKQVEYMKSLAAKVVPREPGRAVAQPAVKKFKLSAAST